MKIGIERLNIKHKKSGFTLAEVLITLGIIGVVAAITIPMLIANYQKKQTVTKLQKAISVINQAYRLAYDDVGEVTAEEARAMGGEEYFQKYWEPYIKTSICTSQTCGYDSAQPFTCLSKVHYAISVNSTIGSRVSFTTLDGFFFIILIFTGDSVHGHTTSSKIWVDINGTSKPNILGKDVFILERKVDGEKGGVVVPACSSSSKSFVDKVCSNTNDGDCCAEKIRRAGWTIDKSYPW